MRETSDKDLDPSVVVPDEDSPAKAPRKASEVEVPSAEDIDPRDGTDQEDKPIDNPSG